MILDMLLNHHTAVFRSIAIVLMILWKASAKFSRKFLKRYREIGDEFKAAYIGYAFL